MAQSKNKRWLDLLAGLANLQESKGGSASGDTGFLHMQWNRIRGIFCPDITFHSSTRRGIHTLHGQTSLPNS